MKLQLKSALFASAALASCASPQADVPAVFAAVETTPVASNDDAADDPAIWVNAANPAASLVLGTDKRAGLYAYSLDGAIYQFLAVGELNNVDLRQNITIGGWHGDIAAASNRTDNSVTLFTIDAAGAVARSGAFASVIEEPYGLCMGARDGAYVFVAYKTGDVVAYRLDGPAGGREAARMKLETQLEGCVFDDETGVFYVGEEDRGIWRADFNGAFSKPALVDEVGGASGVEADVEGLALYKTGPTTGYLIASSQGNHSYAVYAREGDNAFIARFKIAAGAVIDGAEETDGVEAVSANLGDTFPAGAFIAQDGFNAPKGSPQNFKVVDWREIRALIEAAQ